MMAEFGNIFSWFNTRRNHIPKSWRTHSKGPSPNISIDFSEKSKSEL